MWWSWPLTSSLSRDGKNDRVHCAGCDDVIAAVEWGYIRTPLDVLVDLELEPLELLSAAAVLAAAKYVLEHRSAAWVETQNRDHGVAPSRHFAGASRPGLCTKHGAA